MYSLNKAQLIGNVTADPEVRMLPSGQKVANFSVATNRRYTDSAGVQQDIPEYHNIAIFAKLADIAEQYVKKGTKVYIEGRIQTRSWEDQAGQKRYKTEIVAEQLILLSSRSGESAPSSERTSDIPTEVQSEAPVVTSIPPKEEKVTLEDVPF
jgi:single-strand DNA-binding protein